MPALEYDQLRALAIENRRRIEGRHTDQMRRGSAQVYEQRAKSLTAIPKAERSHMLVKVDADALARIVDESSARTERRARAELERSKAELEQRIKDLHDRLMLVESNMRELQQQKAKPRVRVPASSKPVVRLVG